MRGGARRGALCVRRSHQADLDQRAALGQSQRVRDRRSADRAVAGGRGEAGLVWCGGDPRVSGGHTAQLRDARVAVSRVVADLARALCGQSRPRRLSIRMIVPRFLRVDEGDPVEGPDQVDEEHSAHCACVATRKALCRWVSNVAHVVPEERLCVAQRERWWVGTAQQKNKLCGWERRGAVRGGRGREKCRRQRDGGEIRKK